MNTANERYFLEVIHTNGEDEVAECGNLARAQHAQEHAINYFLENKIYPKSVRIFKFKKTGDLCNPLKRVYVLPEVNTITI